MARIFPILAGKRAIFGNDFEPLKKGLKGGLGVVFWVSAQVQSIPYTNNLSALLYLVAFES